MRIRDFVYFAPDVKFAEVDLGGPNLPEQFKHRIVSYYLDPADHCSERGEAFAAGLILVSCIDALARLQYGGKVGKRFQRFVQRNLPSFRDVQLAERFYEDFRNGLIHEARIKKGGQFSLDQDKTVIRKPLVVISPRHLCHEVRQAFSQYIKVLVAEDSARQKFRSVLRKEFAEEFAGVASS